MTGLFTEVDENIVQGVLEENGGSMLKSVMQLWDIKNTITPNTADAAQKQQQEEEIRGEKENLLQSFAIVGAEGTKMEGEGKFPSTRSFELLIYHVSLSQHLYVDRLFKSQAQAANIRSR